MKLTEEDIRLFRSLNKTETGMQLLDYLERLIHSMLDVSTLSKENVEAKKEAVMSIKENLIDRIELVNHPKESSLERYD